MPKTLGRIEWEWLEQGKEEELFNSIYDIDLLDFIQMEKLESLEGLIKVCKIVPCCAKGCQAILVFNNEEAKKALDKGIPYIYYIDRGLWGYEPFLRYAEAAISWRLSVHDMTKVGSRKYYYGKMDDDIKLSMTKDSDRIVTISPRDGYMFRGKHRLVQQNAMDNQYVQKLFVFLKDYVEKNSNNSKIIKAWKFIDVISDNYVDKYAIGRRNVRLSNNDYPCICLPNEEMYIFDDIDTFYDMGDLIVGVIMSIRRVMGKLIPTGKHYAFFRPLFDPMNYIYIKEYKEGAESCIDFIQLTGFEFFDLDRYSSKYKDINSIKIYFKKEINGFGYHYNSLDYTNPKGVDIILNNLPRKNILLYVNDKKLDKDKILSFLNELRRREFTN